MKILLVCLGNICRSPMAHGLLQSKAERENLDVTVDSAGTANYHENEAPDERMQATAKKNGYPIDDLRGRQFSKEDFEHFDLIYAMDEENYENILSLSDDPKYAAKVKMMLNELHTGENMSVPDPYFGGDRGFDEVFDLLDQATDIVIEKYKMNNL